jgi:NDP-sugar pyrophosphorylase family protein
MILSAGLGTRLRPITDEMPKPLVPVVGVPNIVRTILRLKDVGIDEIVINTHWRPNALKSRLQDGTNLRVHISYSDEDTLLGTGGGIKRALPLLGNDAFIVINGDALFAPDFSRIIEFHKSKGGMATMVLRSDPQAETFGALVGIDARNRIRRLGNIGKDTPGLTPRMFAGVHVIEPDIASCLPDEGCIVHNTYASLLETDTPIFGIEDDSFFCDLGTPLRFLDANIDLVTGKERIVGYEPNTGGIYIGRDVRIGPGSIIRSGSTICDGAQIATGVSIEDSVVMEDVLVTQDLHRAIAVGTCVIAL